MNTEIIDIKKEYERALAAADEVLKRGDVAAIPTETVYGLAADALNEEAVK